MTLIETHDSREFNYGAQGGGLTLRFVVLGSTDEVAVYAYIVANTSTTFDGFIRQDVKATPMGGGIWRAEVEYGTTGQGGGDQATGTTPSTPEAPSTDSEPLKGGFSFSIAAPTIHLTQSLATISATKRGGGVAKDYKGAIGVGKDGKVQGCDLSVTGSFQFQRTVARMSVDLAYLRTIRNLCGKVNNAVFYGQAAGEVIYLGCDAQYTQAEGWSLTHKFGGQENQISIDICAGLTVAAKKGFEYLWVAYEEIIDGTDLVEVPAAAYVEQVFKTGNFSLIEIGAA